MSRPSGAGWGSPVRRRALVALAALVVCGLAGALTARHDMPYWGRPQVLAVVTAADLLPDGHVDGGRSTCSTVWRYEVRADDGRTGSFRECATALPVGGRITVRWHPDRPHAVRHDVHPPQFYGALTGGVFLLLAGTALVTDVVVTRRSRRVTTTSAGPA